MPRGAAGADPLTYNQTFQPRNPFPIIRYQALAIWTARSLWALALT